MKTCSLGSLGKLSVGFIGPSSFNLLLDYLFISCFLSVGLWVFNLLLFHEPFRCAIKRNRISFSIDYPKRMGWLKWMRIAFEGDGGFYYWIMMRTGRIFSDVDESCLASLLDVIFLSGGLLWAWSIYKTELNKHVDSPLSAQITVFIIRLLR